MSTRAVVDYMKYWNEEAIKSYLDTNHNNFSVVLHNELKDLNLGSVIRSANAFMAHKIIMLYRRKYDRRSAVGAYKYMRFEYAKDIQELKIVLEGLSNNIGLPIHLVGVDNLDGAKNINDFQYKKDHHTVFVFGHEGCGLYQDVIDILDDLIYIPQYGSVRSLNVAVAAGITMNNFCIKV